MQDDPYCVQILVQVLLRLRLAVTSAQNPGPSIQRQRAWPSELWFARQPVFSVCPDMNRGSKHFAAVGGTGTPRKALLEHEGEGALPECLADWRRPLPLQLLRRWTVTMPYSS